MSMGLWIKNEQWKCVTAGPPEFFLKGRQIFNLNHFLHFAGMWVPSIISKPSLNEVQAQVSCQWILGYKGEEQWSGILRKGGGVTGLEKIKGNKEADREGR